MEQLSIGQLYEQKSFRRYLTFDLIAWVVCGMLLIVGFAGMYKFQQDEYINSILSYCEIQTGKQHASFNADGYFSGCPE